MQSDQTKRWHWRLCAKSQQKSVEFSRESIEVSEKSAFVNKHKFPVLVVLYPTDLLVPAVLTFQYQ